MLGLLVVGILMAGSPGYAQRPAPGNDNGPEVVPIVTRAWAHDDFGRMVFDWPWAVAYGARIEGKTLTVMFDRRLHTTFQQIPRHLGAYITAVNLGPDGQSVVASLSNEYRLRTFLLNSEAGGVKVVVDLLAAAEAGPPRLAQTPPSQPPTPSLPFAVETDAIPEAAQQGEPAPALSSAAPEAPPESAQTADAPPPVETFAPPEPGAEPVPESAPLAAPAPGTTSEEEPSPLETETSPHPAPVDQAPDRPVDDAQDRPLPAGEGAGADLPAEESGSAPAPESASPAAPAPETASEEEPSPLETETSPHPAPVNQAQARPLPAGADLPAEESGVAPEDPPLPETAISPQDGPVPAGGGEASPAEAPSEETAAAPAEAPPAEPTTPAANGNTSGSARVTPPPPEPPQFPTLPVSVRIPVSQSQLFRLDTPVASVFVADPDIADVQLVSSGVLFVVAKAVGRTSVAALDADSALIGEWTISTVLDIQPVRAALEGVPALSNVVVRQLNRGVELSGPVASVADADLALRLTTTALPEETPIQNRLSVTGKQQVNLEVQIAEVQRSVSETLGFNWEVLPDIGGGRDLGFRVGRFFFDNVLQEYIVDDLPEGQAAALFGSSGVGPGRTMVRGLIDALATAGLATVLARPNVTAVSGETASFFSGGEYPLPSGFEDGAIIFEYKKYGVLLDFVPTIIDSQRIMLTVRPEVSQRSDTDSLQVTGIEIPVINVRRAETTVEVGDGESIVIAGLYRDQSEAVESGLPVIKDIPLLGMLFGSQSVRSNATELIVVVTARLTTATTMPRATDRDRQLPGRRLRGYHY